MGTLGISFLGGPRPRPCSPVCSSVGRAESRGGSYTASYAWQDCGLGLVIAKYQGYTTCASPLWAYSHPGSILSPKDLLPGMRLWGSLQQARQPTKRSCFFVFPQPCVALQKSFMAIFVHKAGLRELQDHKQLVSSVLRTLPNTLAFQPLQWRTSQPPSSIYSRNSKILAPLLTSSSLKLSESMDHLGEPAASAALPSPIKVRCGKQQLPCTPSHAHTLWLFKVGSTEKYQNFQDYPTCCRESC